MPDDLVNAATTAYNALTQHSSTGDWEATERLFSDDIVRRDLRQLSAPAATNRNELHRSAEGLVDLGFDEWSTETLELRGSAHALIHLSLSTKSGFTSEWLVVVETDSAGRIAQLVNFDPEEVERAKAELDRMSKG